MIFIISTLLTYTLLFIDVLKGPGSIAKHFIIDGTVFVALTLFIIYYLKDSKITLITKKINKILCLPLTLLYLAFAAIEAFHYPNYVLAAYKIHLDALVFLPLFSILLITLEKMKKEITLPKLNEILKMFFGLTVFILAVYAVRIAGETINEAVVDDLYVLLHPTASYDNKMSIQWPDFYDYMSFVKNNTPDKATIIIPPEIEPWVARTGDIQLVKGFLYPRNIIQGKDIQIDQSVLKQGHYIMISWGDRDCGAPDCHGWPKQKINASKIIYKDPNSSSVIETKENVIYTKDDYKYVYGLIEL